LAAALSGDLPFVDAHSVEVGADPARTWRAVVESVSRNLSAPRARTIARILGCHPNERRGDPAGEGAELPGFYVAESRPPVVWTLRGRHRFSQYSLGFRIDGRPAGRCLLTAETHARFPGAVGAVYRAAVIGTRGHVLATRRMLRAAKGRAERDAT
jgi:hypothetical protein